MCMFPLSFAHIRFISHLRECFHKIVASAWNRTPANYSEGTYANNYATDASVNLDICTEVEQKTELQAFKRGLYL